MFPTPLEAVIFDMDGLLLDTERFYKSAIFDACNAQGHEMIDELHLSLIGTPRELGDSKLAAHFGSRFDLGLYHTECARLFEQLCEPGIPLRPGAHELLVYLRDEGVPTGLATSTSGDNARRRLEAVGILELLSVVVTRSDVTNGKPHPESYLTAARLLDADPTKCVALEDSHNGVRSAAAAGMATIMIPDLLAPNAEIESLCVAVLPSLLDVRDRLKHGRTP